MKMNSNNFFFQQEKFSIINSHSREKSSLSDEFTRVQRGTYFCDFLGFSANANLHFFSSVIHYIQIYFFFRETLNTFTIRRVISGEKKFNREKKERKGRRKLSILCALESFTCAGMPSEWQLG